MAQIFISYSHRDTEQASRIASELERRGWSVWWDPAIRHGESFIVLINREISQASCVVVLWSRSSVTSRWVMEEAHHALKREIICPVMVERGSQLPVGFATVKYIPLWEWRDGEPAGGFTPLIDELERMVGKPSASPGPEPTDVEAAQPAPSKEPAQAPSGRPGQPPLPSGADGKPWRPAVAPIPEDAAPAERTSPGHTPPPPPAPRPSDAMPPAMAAADEAAPKAAPIAPGAKELAERRRYVDFSDMSWMDFPMMGGLLVALAALVASIFSRQILNAPLVGLETLAPILLGLASLFGAAAAERSARNIRSPVAVLLFPNAAPRVLTLLYGLVGASVFAVIATVIAIRASQSYRFETPTHDFIPLPLAAIEGVAAFGFALLALFSLTSMVRALRRGRGP